jgi:hypothetical protein
MAVASREGHAIHACHALSSRSTSPQIIGHRKTTNPLRRPIQPRATSIPSHNSKVKDKARTEGPAVGCPVVVLAAVARSGSERVVLKTFGKIVNPIAKFACAPDCQIHLTANYSTPTSSFNTAQKSKQFNSIQLVSINSPSFTSSCRSPTPPLCPLRSLGRWPILFFLDTTERSRSRRCCMPRLYW